jgi:hypothetical protein
LLIIQSRFQSQLSSDLPIFYFHRSLSTTVHEEEEEGCPDRPSSSCPLDKDVSDVSSHEEVEVGQDGHQEEGTAKKTVESTTVLRIQIRLLEEKKSTFTLHCIIENIVI